MFTKLIKWLIASLLGLAATALLVFLLLPGLHISSLQMILNVAAGSGADIPEDKLLQRLKVEDHFNISVFARDIANPRILRRTTSGRVLVSSPRSGEIIQLSDTDRDGFADSREILMSGLTRPSGLELYQGKLYVAESNQVVRVDYDDAAGAIANSTPETVVAALTDNGNHWSKTIRIRDGWMYVAMGSTCNVCEEEDERRATIMRYRPDGSEAEIYATGLRNSVGMDFAPWDGALYATDNGRDLLGDDYPACELNKIEQGKFYGWPQLNGDNDLDPDFGEGQEALQKTAIPPAYSFPAHNAPLGIHFSEQLERTALVALHGSWNRSTPDGYKVVALTWDKNGNISSRDFAWGFELNGDIVGRPVDIVADGAGGYFISDDYARVIYRISPQQWTPSQATIARQVSDSSASSQASTDVQAGADIIDASDLVADPDLALAGGLLYRNLPCEDCHSKNAATPVPLDELSQHYDLHSLADFFLAPTAPMPLFELSETQREQLAHYLLSIN